MSEIQNDVQPVAIDLISDVICPWCYVGFRALIMACVARPKIITTISMRPFALDPTIPKQGADHKQRLLAKFGRDEVRLKEFSKTLIEAGLAVGIEFDFDAIKITPNTLDCHRLLRWARSAGLEVECAEALFQAYHVEGEDLSQAGSLIAIARGIGMDGDLVEQLLHNGADSDKVEEELDIAQRMGVTGVPCTLFNQSFALMGAQAPETYIAALERASNPALKDPALPATGAH
jgi:predicted DsbA family dithiol-disulfide isomerase